MEVQHLSEIFGDKVIVGHDLDGCASTQLHLVDFSSGRRGCFKH